MLVRASLISGVHQGRLPSLQPHRRLEGSVHECLCMHYDIHVTARQLIEVFCMGNHLGPQLALLQ